MIYQHGGAGVNDKASAATTHCASRTLSSSSGMCTSTPDTEIR